MSSSMPHIPVWLLKIGYHLALPHVEIFSWMDDGCRSNGNPNVRPKTECGPVLTDRK
jgi:hypothetical protein